MAEPRTILITGAGSGIGRGLCQHLHTAGHTIIATDLSLQPVAETVRLLGEGARARAIQLDVTSADSVSRCFEQLSERGIDVLINNAGLQHVSPIEEFSEEKWDQLIAVMLKGTFLMTRAALPIMRARGFGRIINIGSIHSLVASPFKSAYVAAKHALVGFARTVALETGESEITINTICPSYIRTPLVEAQIAAQARSHNIPAGQVEREIMLRPMPKKRFVTIEEVAGTVAFLISDAAKNITAETIAIDGGWTAG